MNKRLTINEIYKYCNDNDLDLPFKNQVYKKSSSPIKFICAKHGVYSQSWSHHKRGSTGCKICRYDKTSKSNRLSWNSLVETCKTKGYDIPTNESEYKNQNSLMTFNCLIHGNYKQLLCSHMQGKTGCKKCEFIKRQLGRQEWGMDTIKEYCINHELDIPKGNQRYKNEDTKYIFICSKHGEYEQSWEKHKLGQGCHACKGDKISKANTKSHERYYQECLDKDLDLPIEDYVNDGTKIRHKCRRCGNVYEQTPSNHLRGQGCNPCSTKRGIEKQTKTPKQYYNECKEKGLDLPVEDYVNSNTKIKHKCKQGHIYEQNPCGHLCGKGCDICNGNKKKTPENYYNECLEKGLDLPIEDYVNNRTRINHRCDKGHVYPQEPRGHLSGQGCFICNESHGEKFIRNYLEKNNIKYIPQKRFDDLKDKAYLSYDFYLPEYNILIEYQGIQHYEECERFGGEKQLAKQQLHDKVKRNYAKDAGYKLLELHYSLDTQDKVDKYLNTTIKGSIG